MATPRPSSSSSSSSEPSIRYRPYVPTDLDTVVSLVHSELSEPYVVYTYRYFLDQWPHLCLIAEATPPAPRTRAIPIGVIVCKQSEHNSRKSGVRAERGYIAMLSVSKQYRKRGIAKTLVHRAIGTMQSRGATEVVLETEFDNSAALGLYESLGFLREKRLFRFYLNGKDAFRLVLPLLPMPGGMVEEELRRSARTVAVSDGNGGGNTVYSQPGPLDHGRPEGGGYGESYGHPAGSSTAGYSNGVREHEVRAIEYEPDLAPGDPADLEEDYDSDGYSSGASETERDNGDSTADERTFRRRWPASTSQLRTRYAAGSARERHHARSASGGRPAPSLPPAAPWPASSTSAHPAFGSPRTLAATPASWPTSAVPTPAPKTTQSSSGGTTPAPWTVPPYQSYPPLVPSPYADDDAPPPEDDPDAGYVTASEDMKGHEHLWQAQADREEYEYAAQREMLSFVR